MRLTSTTAGGRHGTIRAQVFANTWMCRAEPCVLSVKNDDGLVQKDQRVWRSLMGGLEKCVLEHAIAVSSLFGCACNVG
jgi:hypothetical protein